jgi:hypothetical protein
VIHRLPKILKGFTFMRIIILLTAIFATFYLSAAPKQLICITTAEDEITRLQGFIDRESSKTDVYSAESSALSIKGYLKIIEGCKGASFGFKKVFIFDTDALKSIEQANVEVKEYFQCGMSEPDLIKGVVKSTPSIITFVYDPEPRNAYNVDRKTLKGGRDVYRDYTCTIEDVDTSTNLI